MPDAVGLIEQPAVDALPLTQWRDTSPTWPAVLLQADHCASELSGSLHCLRLVAINISNFMDGRVFSCARELRERGYSGQLQARGQFLPDQVHFLRRCGFDSFSPEPERTLEVYSPAECYQGAIDNPLPLFRRRPAVASAQAAKLQEV